MTISDAAWNALTPRERDAKVADVVLGHCVKYGRDIDRLHDKEFADILFNGYPDRTAEPKWGACGEAPHYTSTWEGAGLVIDAMRAKGFYGKISMPPQEGAAWRVVLFKNSVAHIVDSSDPVFAAEADSAPSALALAAYRAMEATLAKPDSPQPPPSTSV